MLRGLFVAILVIGCGQAAPAGPPATAVTILSGQMTVVAKDVVLSPAAMTMGANTALTVTFDNQDGGVPHDLVLYAGPGDPGVKLAATDIITGVASAQFSIPPLVPGQYRFTCTVHPNMTATLTVQPPG